MPERRVSAADFTPSKRARSFGYALRGIMVFFKTTPHAWIHLAAACTVLLLGAYLRISSIEWALLILSIGMVFTAEAVNTAIEIDIDLTSPEYHPYARDTKDVAAGAVLITSLAAFAIGILVFLPHLLVLFQH